MRLQRVLVRKGKDRDFHKWQVTLPPDVVEALGWQPGAELTANAEDGRLIIAQT